MDHYTKISRQLTAGGFAVVGFVGFGKIYARGDVTIKLLK